MRFEDRGDRTSWAWNRLPNERFSARRTGQVTSIVSAESIVLLGRRANKLPPTDHIARPPNLTSIAEGNLRRYIEVLRGTLKIAAHFGKANVVISVNQRRGRTNTARAAIGQSRSQEDC